MRVERIAEHARVTIAAAAAAAGALQLMLLCCVSSMLYGIHAKGVIGRHPGVM